MSDDFEQIIRPFARSSTMSDWSVAYREHWEQRWHNNFELIFFFQAMIKRHHEYTLAYNAQCDSLNPKSGRSRSGACFLWISLREQAFS